MRGIRGYDFSGWAATNNVECTDHTIIRPGAFKDNDGDQVSLVWQHNHKSIDNVLGHAILEDRGDTGTYMYGFLNTDTEQGKNAKAMIQHGDIRAISIYANGLKRRGNDILHGNIKEVSLVLAPADPGAYIDYIAHSDDGSSDEAVIYLNSGIELAHSDDDYDSEEEDMRLDYDDDEEDLEHADEEKDDEKSDSEDDDFILDDLSDDQIDFVKALVGKAYQKGINDANKNEGENTMKHDVFDNNDSRNEDYLSHEAVATIIGDAKRFGSLRDSFLAHAEDYGINQIDWLFPDATNLNKTPEFIKRPDDWVKTVMSSVHHSPFSRVKSTYADITEDEARARGYFKGRLKKEEVFGLLKRTTTPTTVYKKQKLDRDDQVDIVDFDVIGWMKTEMRWMLDEELAGAYLFGDGRLASSDDKIDPNCIRPIVNESDLFAIKYGVAPDEAIPASATTIEDQAIYYAKGFIKAAIRARKGYKGSGNPVMFTSESMLSEMLLLEDTIGHPLYKTEGELATKMRVSRIVTIPDEILARGSYNDKPVLALIVNLSDYYVGADRGGAVNMFEDFDIDYNQQKYLIETRCSGALVKPFSAIVMYADDATGRTSKIVGDEGFKAKDII